MTDALITFLRACLDEEAQEAKAALKRTTTTRRMVQGQWVEYTVQPPEWRRSAWTPARVLAEVEAKRRLLDWLQRKEEWALDNNLWAWDSDEALSLLALPYADHPDYREEWRP